MSTNQTTLVIEAGRTERHYWRDLWRLLPWQFFANAFTEAGNSLISNAGMISKGYFPRLAIPVSTVIVPSYIFICTANCLVAIVESSLSTLKHWASNNTVSDCRASQVL